jgi:hypothetical protein
MMQVLGNRDLAKIGLNFQDFRALRCFISLVSTCGAKLWWVTTW